MTDSKNEYKSILKGSTIFGGVQIFQILISIIRGKIIALLIGPQGSGLFALYNSSINPIILISSLGLNYSAVRTMAQAIENHDEIVKRQTVFLLRKWFVLTALLGCILTLLLSYWLSISSLGTPIYWRVFLLLGLGVFFTILSNGYVALLQGMRLLKQLAKATIAGAFVGSVVTILLVYYWKTDAIVYVIVFTAMITFLINHFLLKSETKGCVSPSLGIQQIFRQGKDMVELGMVFMFSNLMLSLSIYVINIFISHFGSVEQVGLYQSATSITNQYMGLVFSAMSVDYFPRLASIANDNEKLNRTVHQQAEITILIAFPMLVFMILFAPLIVRILFAESYYVMIPLMRCICFGMLIKAAAFSIGYIAGGLNDKKVIFWFEGIGAVLQIMLINMIGYWWGD